MPEYRIGNHWGVTIVREGEAGSLFGLDAGPLGEHGGGCRWPAETCTGHADGDRTDDQLVAVVVNGDQALAERIAWLLTHACPACMGPQRETVGMVCQTCGTDYAPKARTEPESDGPCGACGLSGGQHQHFCIYVVGPMVAELNAAVEARRAGEADRD